MILPSGLQYTLKRVGPKTDPCGTPYLTRLQQERELFTFTEVVRSTRYDRNHSKALSLTPMWGELLTVHCCVACRLSHLLSDLHLMRQFGKSK